MTAVEHRIVVWPDNYGDTLAAGCSCGWAGWYPWDRPGVNESAGLGYWGVPLDVIQAEHDADIASTK